MFDPKIPASLHPFLTPFASCFSKPALQSFSILIIGWISCIGRHTIARMIQAASFLSHKKHHSSLYRFLSHGAWIADDLSSALVRLLLPLLHPHHEIVLIVDDTLCTKSGPHLFGAAMHFDAHRSTYGRSLTKAKKLFAFGHNWVVAALWLPLPWDPPRGVAVPIMSRLYRSPKHCPGNLYRKRTKLAAEMIQLIVAWLPDHRRVHLVADGEYACKTVVRSLPSNTTFTGPMLMNAALYDLPPLRNLPGHRKKLGRPNRKGNRLLSPAQLAHDSSTPWTKLSLTLYGRQVSMLVKSQRCLWYTVAGQRLVTMIVTRDPDGRLEDRAFFSTNHQISVEDLITTYARRWEIEVSFRNLKQHLGLQDPQNGWWRRPARSPRPHKKPGPDPHPVKGNDAIIHTFALALATYAIIIGWYLRHGDPNADVDRVRNEAPWYRHKSTPSFADMQAALRRELWPAFSRNPVTNRLDSKLHETLSHWLLAA